jgi:hypothetical protein
MRRWSISAALSVPRRPASSSRKRSRLTSVASGPSGPVTRSLPPRESHTAPNFRMFR